MLLLDVIGRFMSPSTDEEATKLAPSKMSKSAQNLKALMADVVKPGHEAEAAKGHQESKKSSERKLYCTTISR